MKRFREFIKAQFIREDSAAPNPSSPVPKDPQSSGTNAYHFDKLQDELDIDDKSMKGVIEGGIQTLYKVPNYGWGFRVRPPIQATVKDIGNEQYQVTFLLKNENKRKFMLPYNQGQNPIRYNGPVEDKTVMMNKRELSDLLVVPYEQITNNSAANALSGGMPPMGGM